MGGPPLPDGERKNDDSSWPDLVLIDGGLGQLTAELRERGNFEPSEAAELVLDACEAIAAAHVVGIVHRDLKPSNLFLTQRSDYSRCLKVLDFGISKSLTGDSSDSNFGLTRTRAVVGSPLYMAPEQLESSRNADERADIWSLGVILHELVTGKVPFRGESLPQLVRAVLVGDRVRPSSLNPVLTPAFESIIDRCLAHDREHRYANITELAQALAPFAHTGAASALRVSRILRHSVGPTKSSNPVFEVPSRALSSQALDSKTPRTQPAPIPDATAEAPTVSSWGNTSGTQRGNRRLWLGVGVFLVAAAGAALWLTNEGTEPREELVESPLNSNVPPVTEVVAAGAQAQPSATQAAETHGLETSSLTASVSAESAHSALAATSSAAAMPSAANANPSQPYVPVTPPQLPRPVVGRPMPVAPPPASAEPKPPAFTNFGGRR